MAKRGTSKWYSIQHEEHVARIYHGKRSRSSGAADNDAGDVRAGKYLIECKTTGKPGHVKTTKLTKDFEKIWQEATQEGRQAVLALRYYQPESPFAKDGWVDLVVKLADEDAYE